MKTSNLTFKSLSISLMASLLLSACGSGSSTPDPIPPGITFNIADDKWAFPQENEKNVCLAPRIKLQVETASDSCSSLNRDTIAENIHLREQQDPDGHVSVFGTGGIKTVGEGSVGKVCEISVFSTESLRPARTYDLWHTLEDSGTTQFNQANATEFKTATVLQDQNGQVAGGEQNCADPLEVSKVLGSTSNIKETNVLEFGEILQGGEYNEEQLEEVVLSMSDLFSEALLDEVFSLIIDIGAPSQNVINIEFNQSVTEEFLGSRIYVIKAPSGEDMVDWFQSLFSEDPQAILEGLNTDVCGEFGDQDCIVRDEENKNRVQIKPMGLNGFPEGDYMVVISDNMQSQLGRFLSGTFITGFSIQ